MTSQDFLFFSLAVGFIILASFVSFAFLQLAQTLRSLKQVLDSAGSISRDVEAVKDQIKSGALTAFLTTLNLFLRKRK
jgi:hypothetical protein